MTYPTVNLNGTSAEELLRQLAEAGDAVRRAVEAMTVAQPHGRDYPRPVDYLKASSEYHGRVSRLDGVLHDLQALAENVSAQRDERDRHR